MNELLIDSFIDCAAELMGTPFQHQGRLPFVGVDCIGALVCAAVSTPIPIKDYKAYGRAPKPEELIEHMLMNADRVSAQPGSERSCSPDPDAVRFLRRGAVTLFWRTLPLLPRHLGIYDGVSLIHTWQEIGKVVRHPFVGSEWEDCLHSVWWLRGLGPWQL